MVHFDQMFGGKSLFDQKAIRRTPLELGKSDWGIL
jgi:hypothetical protein